MEKFEMFEEMIKIYLCDENAVITKCRVELNNLGSTVLIVNYTVSDVYAKNNDLWHKNRIMEIMLKRNKGDESPAIMSFADVK